MGSALPIQMSLFENHLMLVVNDGSCYFWNLVGDYVPPFNPQYIKNNSLINFSYEKINCMKIKSQDVRHSIFGTFLDQKMLNQWNLNREQQSECIFILIGNQGVIKLYSKILTIN